MRNLNILVKKRSSETRLAWMSARQIIMSFKLLKALNKDLYTNLLANQEEFIDNWMELKAQLAPVYTFINEYAANPQVIVK